MSSFKEIQGFQDGLRPEEILLVSEWADKHRWIAPGASPEPGQWKTSRFPFLKKIMDVLSSHTTYREVYFKKSAQIGATEMGMNFIGYVIDNSPAATLLVMPTEAMAKKASKTRLGPMINATPRLNKKITRGKDQSNTILDKDFPGGTLSIVGANSPAGLRSMPIKNLMMDEVDAYPLDLGGEGSPISLARARTQNYSRYKLYMPSTPTVEGVSVIDAEYEQTDKQKYFVPCPNCGMHQILVWPQVRWKGKDEGKSHIVHSPPTVYYECINCEFPIKEHHKRDMLRDGDWQATDPEKSNPKTIGFHINSLYSPIYTMERMLESFLKAGNDLNKMNTFVNVGLGECSKPLTDAPKWDVVYQKSVDRQENKVPSDHIKFITVGVDVQKDRLELHVIGWGHDKRRWVIDYRVLPGNVYTQDAWDQLKPVVNEFWVRPDGLELPMAQMCIDSGSYTAEVYNFCKTVDKKRVRPIKGEDNLNRPIGNTTAVNKTKAGKDATGVMLTIVGSSYLKTELYGYLNLNKTDEDEIGPGGYIHLIRFQERYFRGLVAEEERVRRDKKGRNVTEWYVIYDRNEPMDTMNYARAAAALLGMDRFDNEWMDGICDGYQKRTPEPAPKSTDNTLSNSEEGFWGNYE